MSAPEERYVDFAFLGKEDGAPRLARCALLFLDLLGVKDMATGVHAQQNLIDLEQAIRILGLRDFLAPDSAFPAAIFSDTFVMAAPADLFGGDGEAIAGLLLQASWLQLSLAERGFFARGAIALGDFYLRDELVFGEALVEAYDLERESAIHPRVIVSKKVLKVQRQKPEVFLAAEGAPATLLLRDRDGRAFVNYLEVLIGEAEDPQPQLKTHRKAVARKLKAFRGNSRVWEKYRWIAEYHNHFCQKNAKKEWDLPSLLIPNKDLAQELRSIA